jgi:cephalosporin-C deacetylase-like acetyl esterase
VGTFAGLGRYGTYDMAGNVREWCWNQIGEERLIMGGAWDDMLYMFFHSGQKSPFDRSPVNGFRCARYLGHGEELQKAMLPVRIADQRDYAKEKPVDNKTFQVYASLFAYEKCRLDPRIEAVEERAKYWRKEKITLNAGYNDERLSAYLFLPKQGAPPYQTVVLFPGAHTFSQETSLNENDLASFDMIDFLIRGGRAAVYPIYKSMYERRDGYSIYNTDATMQEFREHIKMWRVDLGRTLDYLETRPDIDHDRMGFCGSSLGAMLSIVLLAVEDRFKVAVTRGVGLPVVKLPPDIDALNFAPRVKIPLLMINGRYDLVFPYQTSQLPLFNLLGTAIPQKRLVLFECGHVSSLSPLFPRSKFMQEVLDWLDQYLGPVKK